MSAERISIEAVEQDAKQEQDRPIQNARCGISVFRNRSFVNFVVQPRPKNIEWLKGKLEALAFTDREVEATASNTATVNISHATMNAVVMRPWAWPVDTRLNEAQNRWVKLNELANSDAELLRNPAYKVLNICNDGPWLCPTSSNPVDFCGLKKRSSKTVFEQSTLHFAIGALREGKVAFRGWYNVDTDHCVVPDEIHFGDEFYIAAFDADGASVRVFTENSGNYKPETQQMRSSFKECAVAPDVFKYLHSNAEFGADCDVQDNDVWMPSLKNKLPDEALKNFIVLSPTNQITTVILTKGPKGQSKWFVGDAVKSGEERSP